MPASYNSFIGCNKGLQGSGSPFFYISPRANAGGMEIARSGHTATLLPDGSVLVAGGGIFVGLASAELYQ